MNLVSRQRGITSASRQFTDREDHIQIVHKLIRDKIKSKHDVLVFYGVGGIGKTSLRREIGNQLAVDSVVTIDVLNFAASQIRNRESALCALRKELKSKTNMDCPTFEIAYAILTKKRGNSNYTEMPFIDEPGIVADVISVVSDIPLISILPKITKMVWKYNKKYELWLHRRGSDLLLSLESCETVEIENCLASLLAEDIKEWVKSSSKQLVIICDTYESLWPETRSDSTFFSNDEWMRELIFELPEVIWIIFGREKLRWQELDEEWGAILDQHLLTELSKQDSISFLESCGIQSPKIQKKIYGSTKGLPCYLDLSVDIYFEIVEKLHREPRPSDFANAPREIFDRFLRHLNQSEIEMLKALSVTRFWDYDTFKYLLVEFAIGYPLTAFTEFHRFSFIVEKTAGTWEMHAVMRDALRFHQNPKFLFTINWSLYLYFSSKIENEQYKYSEEKFEKCLIEAAYHGVNGGQINFFLSWLEKIIEDQWSYFKYGTLHTIMKQTIESLISNKEATNSDAMRIYTINGKVLERFGKYPEAEHQFKIAMETNAKDECCNTKAYAKLLLNFALLRKRQAEYDFAIELLQNALRILKDDPKPDYPKLSQAINNIALIYVIQDKNTEAEAYYNMAKTMLEKEGETAKEALAKTLNNWSLLYVKQGKYVEAEAFYTRALELRRSNSKVDNSGVANLLDNLANLYKRQERYREAEATLMEALALREQNLGQDHPDVATILINIGLLNTKQKHYEDAEKHYQRALTIREDALGKKHPRVSIVLNNLALLYAKQERFADAEAIINRAIRIRKLVYNIDHPDIATLLNSLAEIYLAQGKIQNAESLYLRSLHVREESFGKEHLKVADVLYQLGELYTIRGSYAEANRLLLRALKIREQKLNKGHMDIVVIQKLLLQISEINTKGAAHD